MPTTGTSCRRGTSTVLGTMIFIGILFTAFIPMMLVMRQADTLHEMRKHELGILDQEKAREDLYLYVYPKTLTLPPVPVLIAKVQNKGELAIRVVRLWINEDPTELDVAVPPMSTKEIGSFEVSNGGKLYIKLVTDRGNIFPSLSGILTYDPFKGWQIDSYTIYIIIRDPSNSLHIKVGLVSEPPEPPLYDKDVDPNQTGYLISVYEPGTYNVRVTKWNNKPHQEVLYDRQHTLDLTTTMIVIIV